eukprot:SAG31_NODE_27894_length_418_cov_1.454545_1_plen_90_part_10
MSDQPVEQLMAIGVDISIAIAIFAVLFVLNCKILARLCPGVFAGNSAPVTALRWNNAERVNGAIHGSITTVLSAYGLWSAWRVHGILQYD